MNNPEVKKAIADAENELGINGRILVRESGTEPVIRVMVEAQSDEICNRLTEKVVSVIKKKGYCV